GIVCDNGQTISELIIDSSWFFLSWKRDPTIKSMLTMLDAIHQKFKDSPEVWNKLNNITFHYIELQNFGLSDDLYIKMNARGKPLTDFENFKAKFEQHIDKWENYSAPTKTFAHKIDTVWTDLFWRYKEKIERIDDEGRVTVEYRIDDHITNFIAATVINYYAQNLEIQLNEEDEEKVKKELEKKIKAKNVTDNAVKRERIERRITTLFNNPREITFNDLPTQGAFEYLVECFDRYSQNNSTELKFDVDLWKYCEDTLFKDIIQNKKLEWKNRAVFYAQTTYLLKTNLDRSSFNDWIRVVRNIIENSTINDVATYMSAVNLIRELSNGWSDIYEYLTTNTVNARHAESQVKEEIEKAKIIIAYPDAKQVIHVAEDTHFCKGRIDFLLYCTDYDIENPDLTTFDKDKLEKVLNVIQSHFESNDEYELFVRSFLTIKKNDYYKGWWHWSSGFDCHKGYFYSPTRMKTGKDSKYKGFSVLKNEYRDYLKELIIQLVGKGSFKQIIDDYNIPSDMPKWKQRLIKEENWLNGATFILIPDDNSYCKLAWQQRPSRDDQVRKVE